MSKSDKAFEIQEEIGRKIEELEDLGFEFMWHNRISSIRRTRKPITKNKEIELQNNPYNDMVDDKTAELDAQSEKNEDHARDSMTNDLKYNEHDNEWS
tara:strand:+ start:1292 stop:1585 length:294 start_codon:yes stop_codon:yes gene_type:complete